MTFRERKARQIREIARRVEEEFGGEVPCDEAVLLSFPCVGPKCANLVLGLACGEPRVKPHCSTCPVLEYCRQVGVTEHR